MANLAESKRNFLEENYQNLLLAIELYAEINSLSKEEFEDMQAMAKAAYVQKKTEIYLAEKWEQLRSMVDEIFFNATKNPENNPSKRNDSIYIHYIKSVSVHQNRCRRWQESGTVVSRDFVCQFFFLTFAPELQI